MTRAKNLQSPELTATKKGAGLWPAPLGLFEQVCLTFAIRSCSTIRRLR